MTDDPLPEDAETGQRAQARKFEAERAARIIDAIARLHAALDAASIPRPTAIVLPVVGVLQLEGLLHRCYGRMLVPDARTRGRESCINGLALRREPGVSGERLIRCEFCGVMRYRPRLNLDMP